MKFRQFYFGGVFYLPCTTTLDHGILIVGYDVETDIFFQKMPYCFFFFKI